MQVNRVDEQTIKVFANEEGEVALLPFLETLLHSHQLWYYLREQKRLSDSSNATMLKSAAIAPIPK